MKSQQPSLAVVQTELEAATKELKLSQTAFMRASERLENANVRHEKAMEALNQAVASTKTAAKVKNLFAQ